MKKKKEKDMKKQRKKLTETKKKKTEIVHPSHSQSTLPSGRLHKRPKARRARVALAFFSAPPVGASTSAPKLEDHASPLHSSAPEASSSSRMK